MIAHLLISLTLIASSLAPSLSFAPWVSQPSTQNRHFYRSTTFVQFTAHHCSKAGHCRRFTSENSVSQRRKGTHGSSFSRLILSSSNLEDNAPETAKKKRRKRVRRKDSGGGVSSDLAQNDQPASDELSSVADRQDEADIIIDRELSSQAGQETAEDAYVEVQVRNLRDMGGGQTQPSAKGTESEQNAGGEYSFAATQGRGTSSGSSGKNLDKLLADARRMRASSQGTGDGDSDGSAIGDTIGSVISTIVTVDFFVVCGLLLWFLAGIFCSYVLKDDAVQIAFNGIFQPVVQPVLGILMIGSAAGAILKKEDE